MIRGSYWINASLSGVILAWLIKRASNIISRCLEGPIEIADTHVFHGPIIDGTAWQLELLTEPGLQAQVNQVAGGSISVLLSSI